MLWLTWLRWTALLMFTDTRIRFYVAGFRFCSKYRILLFWWFPISQSKHSCRFHKQKNVRVLCCWHTAAFLEELVISAPLDLDSSANPYKPTKLSMFPPSLYCCTCCLVTEGPPHGTDSNYRVWATIVIRGPECLPSSIWYLSGPYQLIFVFFRHRLTLDRPLCSCCYLCHGVLLAWVLLHG